MQPVTINGQIYIILRTETPTAKRASGYGNTAHAMEQAGIAQELVIQKPAGRKLYTVNQYRDGRFGPVLTYPTPG